MSAKVKPIQESLSFLNKFQLVEDGETRNSSNREPPKSRLQHSSSVGHNQRGRYRPRSQPQNIRCRRHRENSSYDQNRHYNEHSIGRELWVASLQRRQRSQMSPNADPHSSETSINDSRDRNAVRNIPSGKPSPVNVVARTLDLCEEVPHVVLPEGTDA